jgi:adenylate kinase family enzyme
MAVKIFVLGLPGSGKSTVCRRIALYITDYSGWSALRINDYHILYKMFQEDTEGKYFHSIPEYSGFDVHNFIALNLALQKLEQEVKNHISNTNSDEIILIEFSRNNYQKAFQQFSKEFLQDAYFLYLSVDLETCKRRISERISNPISEDDFFVSEYIFNSYYNEDNGEYIPQILARDYGVDKQKVQVIDNNCSLQDSIAWIHEFVNTICDLESIRN